MASAETIELYAILVWTVRNQEWSVLRISHPDEPDNGVGCVCAKRPLIDKAWTRCGEQASKELNQDVRLVRMRVVEVIDEIMV